MVRGYMIADEARETAPTAPVGKRRHFPFVTAAVWLATATATALGILYPAVLDALMRRPGALAAGEWWRLVTPLLVHDKGWSQILINLAGIAAIGAAVERVYGGRRWLALYAIAGVVGQIAASVWYPVGAGASVGIAGLSGGLLAWLLARRAPVPRVAPYFMVFLTASLVGRYGGNLGIPGGDTGGAIAACTLLGAILTNLPRFGVSRDGATRVVALVGLLGAVALVALRDIHGPAILVAVGVAATMLRHGRRTPLGGEA